MEYRIKRVQKQLDDLGYRQVLIPEALPLIEKLTADLIQTTESLKKYKQIAKDVSEERDSLQLGAEPYKRDNAKLVKECNELHLAFLQFREQNEQLQKDLKRKLVCCEKEKHDSYSENEKLRKRIRDLEFESASKTDRLLASKTSLSEIERLTKMLEGGRPLATLSKEVCCDSNINLNHLQNQITLLKKEKCSLEVCLKVEAVDKQHEAMNRALTLADRNKQLENELRDIDQMALEVEADCNTAVKSTAQKVKRLENKVHQLMLQVQSNDREIMEIKRDKQDLMSDLDALKVEKKHLQSVLEIALEEKKRLANQVNQFNIIEHDLNLEIDRLVQTSANQKRKIAELECQLISGKVEAISDHSVKRDSSSERLKSERDFYIKEYRRVSEQVNCNNKPVKLPNSQCLAEKDNLIANLQHENIVLAQEKHNLLTRLESARDFLEDGDVDGFCIKSALRKSERERDMLKADVFRLEEERDALRQRLKTTMDVQMTERCKMEKTLAEADNEIRRLELERHDLIQSQGSRRGTIGHLEQQCELLKEELQKTQTELNQKKALYCQLKTLHEQTDTALADSQAQISQLEAECRKSIKTCCDPSKDAETTAALRDEISYLKHKLIQFDKEKDSLLISLDVKTERIASLEQDMKAKDAHICLCDSGTEDLKKKIW
ncbi:hypothetical protein RN001_002350 [Aquatica leii]|uniref:Centrosomal protein of 135 kDa n=1 Tax=Aquatica leii TaxID=1421715 RepID=A0AAN7SLS8_9COLE|nr:hypothetical protein RN001_002350 [Aquatica leii]